jgi:hypothetical protein
LIAAALGYCFPHPRPSLLGGENIIESSKLKQESSNLLNLAKLAVEIAIEEGEEKAIEYINSHTVGIINVN